MGITERKQRQKEELRQRILMEARKLIREEGCPALSIRKLADAIEYSVPVVYEHFSNKEAILLEFTKEGFAMLADDTEKAAAGFSDPETRLEAVGRAYWAFAFTHKEYYSLMFGMGMPSCESVKEIEEVGRLSKIFQEHIKAVIFSKGSAEDVFLKYYSFWSMLHGLVSINILEPTDKRKEMTPLILDDMIRVFIRGLG